MSNTAKRKQKTTRKTQTRTRSVKSPNPKSEVAKNAAPPRDRERSKFETLLDLMRRKDGATIEEMMKATGWQAHSVRGALSGTIKKKLGLKVISAKVDGVRRYSIKA